MWFLLCRFPVPKLLPPVPPAYGDAAWETPLPGTPSPQHSRPRPDTAGALLCGLPPIRKGCVAHPLQRVCFQDLQQENIKAATKLSVFIVFFCLFPEASDSMSLSRCPNPLDPASEQAVILDPRPPPPHAQTRRFTISTFQFLPEGQLKVPNEEVKTFMRPMMNK